jgi:hypothetical protein
MIKITSTKTVLSIFITGTDGMTTETNDHDERVNYATKSISDKGGIVQHVSTNIKIQDIGIISHVALCTQIIYINLILEPQDEKAK